MIDIATWRAAAAHPIRIHATNVVGLGAVRLAQSLLPAIEHLDQCGPRTVFLPQRGALASYQAASDSTTLVRRRRYLPNAISRILECTLFGRRFGGEGSLLVLGDIPLRCVGRQTVFVQTPLLTNSAGTNRRIGATKYWIARCLFRLNARFASAFIVQTEAMKNALSETYPDIAGRLHVIGHPAPEWLLSAGLKRNSLIPHDAPGLELFYPAAGYPHKNHRLLSQIDNNDRSAWPISSLTLTIGEELHPNRSIGWIRCVGRLEPQAVLERYRTVDGLLFLSLSESFGFPLVEAMWIGLPIICPELPYSRILCGDEAIYFDPEDIGSLHTAVTELQARLEDGWWPNWSEALKKIPASWEDVAATMLHVTTGQERASVD